ncbi:FtsH protease activity modulator HflK [Aliifodinibius sp. S!AR15-10]|uniref:FtsH protease activity modulator HflK n=1 Tax=Aliifodinibius sp. S!AR15-10 TaxID=2950437 RepID=UPI00285ACBD4|nr:FtsH protease activity modulator HflK [Aliifodinibius sp. S!AR15-10]MDR8392098.1 FtsH protease activity modulator HflK [Aliifodinibius sp. S!AR15-10]
MADQPFSGPEMPDQLKKLSGHLRLILLGVIAFVLAFTSFFTVDPEEVGVVMRFGEFTRTTEPGLNFKIPFVEEVQLVPIERQLKLEFGYRTISAGVQSTYQKEGYRDESLMLTGDLNLADVEWVVQYRVDDPFQFLFKIRNPEQTLRDASEAAIRQIVGDRTVNEVLTVGRAEVATRAEVLIQSICEEYENGIRIEQVVLQDVNPPERVKPSFNDVNEAQQQRETLINEAKSAYNRVIPRARGQAQETIQKAEGYAVDRVNRARGEVARFNDLYAEYLKAPEVTKQRLYLETLEEILPKIGNKVVTDQNGNGVLPLLQMQMNGSGVRNLQAQQAGNSSGGSGSNNSGN